MSGSQFDFDGRGYLLPRLTEGDKKKWLLYCNAQAIGNLEADREMVTEGLLDFAAYTTHAKQVTAWVTTRFFHYDAEGGEYWWRNDDARAYLIALCLARANENFTMSQALQLLKKAPADLVLMHWKIANANPTAQPASAGGDSPSVTSPPVTESAGDSSSNTV